MSLTDMPTVSICVPARNETFALAGCLDSILASDYPKLEVIVLDDCSQDTTSQLIKSYAHAGVRFVEGRPPEEGWLGRNQAFDVLMKESSGDYLLFVDVDTRMEAQTISQLIDYALLKRLTMISVLPERRDPLRASVFLSPLRYFWQMIIPQFIHTPAATSLWLVRREKLLEIGGFEKVKNAIMPENMFARTFDLHGTYRYLLGGHLLGVFYAKKWRSQIKASLRLSYPTLGKQPFAVLVISLSLYLLTIVPFIVILSSAIAEQWNMVSVVAFALTLAYALPYLLYTREAWHNGWLLTTILLPVVLLQEIALIVASMIGYEFDKITWKGRNICYPVLRRPR
jgi:glycosyltransferase involved in cell wall biosynthesis